MKLYKSLLAAMVIGSACVGFTSCDNNFDCPPVISPDLGGNGRWDAPLTVKGATAYYTAYYSEVPDADKNYWVHGYIVGCVQTTETVFTATEQTVNMTGNFTTPNNILIAATPDETNYENCLGIQLPSGAVRSALNLMDNPGNLGKEVCLYGYIDKYLGLPGMRSVVNFNFGPLGIDTGDIDVDKSDYALASEIKSGRSYALVANGTAAQTPEGDNGFLRTSAVTISGGKFTATEKYGFLFTETEAGSGIYYINDYKGRFLYQDVYGSGWSNRPSASASFVKDNNGYLWQPVKNGEDRWVISNVASTRILAFDTQYGSYGLYESLTSQYLAPELYEMANDPVTVPDFTPGEGPTVPDVTEGTGEGTLASPYDAVKALAIAKAGGSPDKVYITGIISSIKEIDTGTYGNASYYISNDGTSAGELQIYRGYGLNGAKFTSNNDIKVGDKVVILGQLVLYNGSTPQVTQGSSIISINGNGGGSGDTPSTEGEIYKGLTANCDDWTLDQGTLPEGATYVWSWKVYNDSGYLNASAYVGGAALVSEAYAYHALDLSGYKNVNVNFDHAAKFQTTLLTLCGMVIREQGSSAWNSVAIPTWPAAGSWTFVNSGSIDLSAYAGKKVEVGFKYASNATGADTWEIKNFVVNASK
ncbi:MAG: hypothetical protein K2N91_01415 [Muribaculaceae bacterium]|nr:hypothetical protein [Muribaculaceae bacterium]